MQHLRIKRNNKTGFFPLMLLISLFLISSNIRAEKPNVLLIFSDDLNTRIGPYMNIDKHTPNLDRLADMGIRFTRTYAQYPICGPSRASIMSGLYPETNGVLNNNDEPGSYKKETPALANHPSLAGLFRNNGYFTARVSKIFHMGVPGGIERGAIGGDIPEAWDYAYNVMGPETQSPGELELLSPKFHHYGANFAQMIIEDKYEETQTDYIAASQAIAILESRAAKVPDKATNKVKIKPDDPFFLAVGFVRPHVPLVAPRNCFEPYPYEEMTLPPGIVSDNVPEQALRRQNKKIWGMSKTQQKKVISGYMASVRFMDQQVGRLMNALDRLDLRDNTMVIFLSDHGYNLGEHKCWSKISLWEGSVRVPMIISSPFHEDGYGTKNATVIELIDLYPTITEICGMDELQPDNLQGKSLLPILEGKKMDVKNSIAYTITRGNGRTIRTKRWRYTRWGDEANISNEELYDHQDDPEEHNNLIMNSDYEEVIKRMRNLFDKRKRNAMEGLAKMDS